MGKTLVTGATGFVGSSLARALAKRGDELKLTVRKASKLENLSGLDFEKVTADVLDTKALRRAMKGVTKVFHVAGCTNVNAGRETLFKVNVQGTRNVLSEALRAGVERVVHTSSVAAIGPAKPRSTADESALYTVGKLGLDYPDSKHEAEIEAFRFAAKGLSLVVVNPSYVLGKDDVYLGSTRLVSDFLRKSIPIYVDGGQNIVDVDDVATGHLLADRKGKAGERYIIAGSKNFSIERLLSELSRLSGVEPPTVKLPLPLALQFARAAELLPVKTPLTTQLVKNASQWWTYKIDKAKRELGYRPRPAEETLTDTIEWCLESSGGLGNGFRQPLVLRVVGQALRFNRRLAREAEALVSK